MVAMGRKEVPQQIAHLFCELFTILRAVGLTNGSRDFPMTQAALGEALGLSTVHGGWREGEVIMSQHKGAGRIAVENVNYPGKVRDLDAAAYDAMRAAILKVLPSAAPGLTVAELGRKVATHLPEDIFPVGSGQAGGSRRCNWILKRNV
jgi:hypothetical protein